VKRIVALRGDLPSGYGASGEFRYASDLVAFIRAETGRQFHLEVACLPRGPSAGPSPEADLQAFVAKIEAGADSAHHAVLLQRRRLRPLPGRRCASWGVDRCRWCRA
jgi:5,10-methylenetetrahydrofolate reductase